MKDFDAEIKNLEAKLEAVKAAKKAEQKRIAEAERLEQKQFEKAAQNISKGVCSILEGFKLIMPEEDVKFLSDFLFNAEIIPLAYSLVALSHEPLFTKLVAPYTKKNLQQEKSKSVSDIDNIIADFVSLIEKP